MHASTLRTPLLSAGCSHPWTRRLADNQWIAMCGAFQRHGGLATANEVARLMRRSSQQPLSTLARWLVDRAAIQLEWQGQTLLPLFQFDDRFMLDETVAAVVRELRVAFDDWELALWFATPNDATGRAAPVDALQDCPLCVLAAARADRFVALG